MGQSSFIQRFAVRYFRLVLDRPRWVLALAAAITLLFASQIPRLTFSTSVYDLIIQDLPENQTYGEFKKRFGSDEIIRVVVKGADIFDPETFAALTALSDALGRIQGVRQVVGLPEVRRAVDLGGTWSMEKFAAVMKPVALFERNLFSADRRTAALTLMLVEGADQNATIAAVAQALAASDLGAGTYQIGMPLVSQALERLTRRDFFRLPPVTLLLIVLILWGIFRRGADLLLPLVCVGTTLVWTFGFIALTGTALSMLTMIVPVFLIAVGTAYCLHIVAEYHVWIPSSPSAPAAVQGTFRHTAFPTALAVATTALGLASLFLSRIPMIREFALFACFGICALLAVLLSVFPALLALMPLPEAGLPSAPKGDAGRLERLIQAIVGWTLQRQRKTLTVFALAAVLLCMGAFQLKVETNPMRYFKADVPVSRHFHDVYQDLCGAFPINLVIDGGQADFFEDPAQIRRIAEVQAHLETLAGVDKTISVADYLKLVNYATNGFDAAYYTLPEAAWELRMLFNSFKTLLGEEMLRRFVSADLGATNVLLMTHLSNSRDIIALRREITRYLDGLLPPTVKRDLTGFSVVVSASSDLITRGQVKSLGLTMAVVFAIMFALFLSVRVGLIAIMPNLFPILVNLGVMGWFGIELSMFTSLIASIAIGLAVDDTIHYLVRYNREFKSDLDDERALAATLHHIGRPIVYTTATISTGFAILTFSSFQPTAVFGLLMVVTLVSALAGDLLLLPILMRHAELVTLWDLVRIKLGVDPREGLPLFHGLSRTEVHYIIVAGALRQAGPGEVVFRKGDPSDSMYAVIDGELEVLDHPTSLDPILNGWDVKRLDMLHSGDVVGEMGLLRNAPRSATVVARKPTELLQINMNMIRRLQWLYPPAAQRFFINLMNLLCHRIARVSECLFESSRVDDLSGLYNRRVFLQRLEQELQRCRRYGIDLSLCLLSLGNDARGLSTPSDKPPLSSEEIDFLHRLPGMVRQNDTIGRIDHRLLGILMPHTPPAVARQLCARLCQALEGRRLAVAAHLVRLDDMDLVAGETLLRQVLARAETLSVDSLSGPAA